jgi:DDE superfamily endonuclease
MTGIQALERANPSLPVKPGHVERREFEYTRHGTKALIAAFDFASGKVRSTVSNTRTEADFVSFLDNLFASPPRDLVLDPGPQASPPRQLHLQGPSAVED